jgi:hypothetical protein
MPTSSERKIVKDRYLGRHSIRKSSSLVDLWSNFGNFCNFWKTPQISMQSTSECFLMHLECLAGMFPCDGSVYFTCTWYCW